MSALFISQFSFSVPGCCLFQQKSFFLRMTEASTSASVILLLAWFWPLVEVFYLIVPTATGTVTFTVNSINNFVSSYTWLMTPPSPFSIWAQQRSCECIPPADMKKLLIFPVLVLYCLLIQTCWVFFLLFFFVTLILFLFEVTSLECTEVSYICTLELVM